MRKHWILILIIGLPNCAENNQNARVDEHALGLENFKGQLEDSSWCAEASVLSERFDFSKVRRVKLENINGPHYLTAEQWGTVKSKIESAQCVQGLLCKPKSLAIWFEFDDGEVIDGYFCDRFLNFDRPFITGSFELEEKTNFHNY